MLDRRDRDQDPRHPGRERPVYVAIGVNLDGERDVLGIWIGPSGGEAEAVATMPPTS